MSDITNGGATNGASNKKTIKCVVTAGEFMQMLLDDKAKDKVEKHPGLKFATIQQLEQNQETISIKLEENTREDIKFLEFIKKNPMYANMKFEAAKWKEIMGQQEQSK